MLDLLQNVCDRFGSHERLWGLVVEPNELVDRCDQLRHAREDAAPNPLARNLTEPPLNPVQPRGTRRGKVQVKSWMFHEPLLDIGVVVRSVIVRNQVEGHLVRRDLVNGAQELQKLLVAMPRVTGSDHGAAAPLLHRQARLCPIQRLDLRFFIHAQHHRLVWGVEVDAHHIRQLLHKPRVLRQLERFDPVRLQAVRVPDSGHAGMADPLRIRHRPCAPVGRVWRRRVQGGLHDGSDFPGRQAVGTRPVRGIRRQTRRPRVVEPFPPQRHGRTRGLQAMRNRIIGESLGRQQANPRPQDDPLGGGLRPNPRPQRLFLFNSQVQRVGGIPHAADVARPDQHCKVMTETLH